MKTNEETLRLIVQDVIMDKKGNRKRQLESNNPSEYQVKTYLEIARLSFLAAKSQATKELLEEVGKIFKKDDKDTIWSSAVVYFEIKQIELKAQLSKVGEVKHEL